jgi:CheY-like chemotaxis protein
MRSEGPIIVVDDDTDDHFIIQEIAQRLQINNRLLFFRDANDVLNYLRLTPDNPFIILCDINMPQMTGLELRRILISEEKLRRKSIPFVFFSTAANAKQVNQAYDLTVQGFFIKEPRFEESAQTIKLILDYWKKCLHPNNFK